MNTTGALAPSQADLVQPDGVNIAVLRRLLARRKGMLLALPLLAGTLCAAIAFALPDVYRASVRLLPPQQQGQGGAAALLSQLGGGSGGLAALKNPADVYVGMLKSRTVADQLVAKYDLKSVYGQASADKTRKKLGQNTRIAAEKEGFILIEVDDADAARAAALGNAYVAALAGLNQMLAVTEASQRRVFFERQLGKSRDQLAAAEIAMKQALDTGGVISVDGESRAALETVGRIRAQISAKEIELASLAAFVTTSNPDYLRVQAELGSLRRELSHLENGRSGAAAAPSGQPAGLGSIQILRDVKYHQMLYELLAKQYELARLDEAKDSALLQVLDAAVAPERPVGPPRALWILMAMAAGLALAVALIVLQHVRAGGPAAAR
jgi:tyrosine-protein kinase Etk/Wzc